MTTDIPPGVSPSASVPQESGQSESRPDPSPEEAVKAVLERLAELRCYVIHYLSAKADELRLSARRIIVLAILGIVGVAIAVTGVVVAVVLLLAGLAHGLGRLLWHQAWLGDVVVGGGIILGIAIGARVAVVSMSRQWRRKLTEKYESFQREQRERFGRDAQQTAGRR